MADHGYRIEIEPHRGEVTAFNNGNIIAKSNAALILRETRLPDLTYFPKDAIDPAILVPSERRTFCPFKGTASYWHVETPAGRIENGAWAYENPLKESAEIGNYIAFMKTVADQYSYENLPAKNNDDGHINGALSDWILREAGYCSSREELVRLLGRKLVENGVAVFRLSITIWSLHPEIAGMNYQWSRDSDEVKIAEPSHDVYTDERYLNSPMRLVTQGLGGVRQPLTGKNSEFEFPIMEELKALGATDYVAMPLRFSDGQYHPMTLASDHQRGFTTENLGLIFECMGVLSRYFEVLTLRANTVALLDTYLGKRTGQKVLQGDIHRGQGENIQAVILFSDLRSSSRMAEELPRTQYLELLNRYFETVLGPIKDNGGEVLKFIGDAVLAIFPLSEDAKDRACKAGKALTAARQAIAIRNKLAEPAMKDDLPSFDLGIGLHIGEVTYGNVGGQDRLDFTVIGPAVNLASRIESLCKTTGNRILMSSDFKAALADEEPSAIPQPLRPIGEHQFDGISSSHTVYALS